jgi:hypothetical protein
MHLFRALHDRAVPLQDLITSGSPSNLQAFFQSVGPPEAACLCIAIALPSSNPDTPQSTLSRAEAVLADSRYVGAPSWPPDLTAASAAPTTAVVTSASKPDWSDLHHGAALFLFRVLHKIWETPLLRLRGAAVGAGGGFSRSTAVQLTFPPATLHALQDQLMGAAAVISRAAERLQQDAIGRDGGVGGIRLLQDASGLPAKRQRRESAATVEGEHLGAMRCSSFCVMPNVLRLFCLDSFQPCGEGPAGRNGRGGGENLLLQDALGGLGGPAALGALGVLGGLGRAGSVGRVGRAGSGERVLLLSRASTWAR